MKGKAFTLIELLVVIAIIAILAAILFPVLTQAKIKAKQTASIANMNQFAKAMMMYTTDYDDTYSRADYCAPKGSFNPNLNKDGAVPGDGCTNFPFAYRINHYKWQMWLKPYTNSVAIFYHPSLEKDQYAWDKNGEIFNLYALNLAITGALNTWGNEFKNGAYRNSFLGGRTTDVPDPSSAMLFLEFASSNINFAPTFLYPSGTYTTAYPAAHRELWAPVFMKWKSNNDCTPTDEVDKSVVPFNNGIVIARCDGSVKWMHVKRFLEETPTKNDYITGSYAGGWECGATSGARTLNQKPVWNKEWPLWALQ